MTKNDNKGQTVYDAMQRFSSIVRASEFSPSEVAIFYVILQTWNSARRPAVVELWARTFQVYCGIHDERILKRCRNRLVQKGVIFFSKKGNRGVPKYSLNALFELDAPETMTDDLLVNITSKHAGKVRVNTQVKCESKQGQGTEDKIKIVPASQIEVMERINVLYRRRITTQWNDKELRALRKIKFEEEDLVLIEAYAHPKTGSKYRRKDIVTLLNNWNGEVDRARAWQVSPERKDQQITVKEVDTFGM